jgi:hypothetical protein
MRLLLAIVSAAVIAAAAAGAVVPATSRTLVATVGAHDAYVIKLALPSGKRVTSLPAGNYTIVVHDLSKLHNFALGSVTANRRIFTGSVPAVGIKSYRVKLVPGSYAYACSAHPTTMHSRFTVT